ncbi:T9SS type A sorting domain-containing protein [Flavobacterium sp. CYK-55]|uniref:T9SS type A sorting domain-containing protein n=1 Tax=Flavobacterium sp. CYK-55 TaxID=2835529 RepID=UPI001BD001D1|nr:T9SS type A sorting domain-containing protein [Flavobacterium sp. CYK-55]MBS7786941.1 T9SS type A sorting domain-containing protein [Flavobacterium sp. CYK-55]
MSLSLVLFGFFFLCAQENIKLIGFSSNGNGIDNLVQWNAGETNFTLMTPTNYVGVLVGSSVYNSNVGTYYSRVLVEENNDYVSKMFRFNTTNATAELTEATTVYNGSAEVDMQTGMLYSYDGDLDNNLYLNRYNPLTQSSTNLGYFELQPNTFFFPDASAYDSDNGFYYFVIQDDEGKKLVKASISNDTFTHTIIPITGTTITGNIGLEFSMAQNKIFAIYPDYNSVTGTTFMRIGQIDPNTGAFTNETELVEISGLQLFNRSYDQNTEKLLFIGNDLQNQQRLYAYNTLTGILENLSLPATMLIEIEADNYQYAVQRYPNLSTNKAKTESFTMAPNPADDLITIQTQNKKVNYSLWDLVGKNVAQGSIQEQKTIDVSFLSPGMYHLILESDAAREVKKLSIR